MADKPEKTSLSSIKDSAYKTRYAPTADTDIYYPESDGKPMAETERHRDGMIGSIQTLSLHYIDAPDVCVSGNLMMYHEEGNPQKSISPDVFVAFGVSKKQRRIYQIWNEGKPPDFVLEYSSSNTYRRDLNEKKDLYAEIGITEYFLYDAERRLLPEPIMGYRLVDGKYVPISPDADGSVYSETLNLELRLRGEELGFYDITNEQWLETPAEAATIRAEQEATARQQAEAKAEQAEAKAELEGIARQLAEEEIAQLREEIARLKS